jgi:hypothetical protein
MRSSISTAEKRKSASTNFQAPLRRLRDEAVRATKATNQGEASRYRLTSESEVGGDGVWEVLADHSTDVTWRNMA